jgi:glycosyltransferase involved in cell wall biosynthesis
MSSETQRSRKSSQRDSSGEKTWIVLTPHGGPWLTPHLSGGRHRFTIVEPPSAHRSWHQRSSKNSGGHEWNRFSRQAVSGLRAAGDGYITTFPQLPALVAQAQRLRRTPRPIVAGFFDTNVGVGFRKMVQSTAYKKVDRFIVHTTAQQTYYAEQFGLDLEKFEFIHLQVDYQEIPTDPIDEVEPFVFATGSGYRDYGTFFEAMKRLGYPARVVAGPRILAGLTVPKNVHVLDLPRGEIRRQMRKARVNVMPVTFEGIVAGTVTLAETLRVGRALVTTDRAGVSDYVTHENRGLLHKGLDVASLCEQIDRLWTDRLLGQTLDQQAAQFAQDHLTDAAAGRALLKVLDQFG